VESPSSPLLLAEPEGVQVAGQEEDLGHGSSHMGSWSFSRDLSQCLGTLGREVRRGAELGGTRLPVE